MTTNPPLRERVSHSIVLLVLGIVVIPTHGRLARAAQEPATHPAQTETKTAAPSPAPVQAHEANHASIPDSAKAKVLSASELEEQYGLRVTLIAVTGGGGLIDFRFKVLDPEKAKQVVDPRHIPALQAGDSGAVLSAPMGMAHNIRMQKDTLSSILFPNVRNAIKAGTAVSAVFGSVRVEPIKAQ